MTDAEPVDVLVVGAGPAGLAAAAELSRDGRRSVLVLDREREPGGIPRHARHQGFGLRDLRRPLTGPAYARRWASIATGAGAVIRTRTQVTGWSETGGLEVTSPEGRGEIQARAVVLATGCRERPRSARLVAGSRPHGVLTTGMLQQLVYLTGQRVGRRAVVVGAEHVSFSALLTLAHGGARAVLMTTESARHQSFAVFHLGAALRFGTRLRTGTAVTRILGRGRVEAAELSDLDSGQAEEVACDTVVFTADWIPDHELAELGGARLDPGTLGPAVDPAQRTTMPGVFAAGNVIHGAETADVAALSGRHVAPGVCRYLEDGRWPASHVDLVCEEPLAWMAPNLLDAKGPAGERPARRRFLLRARDEVRAATIELSQDGRTLLRTGLRRIGPGRSASLDPTWLRDVDRGGGPVRLRVLSGRR